MGTTSPARRRWFRYSLRSFLLVFTLICVALGWKLNRLVNQRRVVADVKKFAESTMGNVNYDYEPLDHVPLKYVELYEAPEGSPLMFPSDLPATPPGPKWLRSVLGDDFFADLVGVDIETQYTKAKGPLRKPEINEEVLAHIGAVPTLTNLTLCSNGITDRGLAYLAKLRHLKRLSLDSRNITDAGLEQISELTELILLDLHAPQVTDQGIRQLIKLTQLRGLVLCETKISGNGIASLQSLPHLYGLTLFVITDSELAQVATLNRLKFLSLGGKQITDEGLARLREMSGLKSLSLRAPQVTNEAVERLRAELPDCKIVRD